MESASLCQALEEVLVAGRARLDAADRIQRGGFIGKGCEQKPRRQEEAAGDFPRALRSIKYSLGFAGEAPSFLGASISCSCEDISYPGFA